MRIGVIGLGTVGQAMAAQFAKSADIVGYDPIFSDRYPEAELAHCDFAVVCVNTPMAADGSSDTSRVDEAVKRLPVERLLIKSTIPPGTTDRLVAETDRSICFSPEYIGETAFSPWANQAGGVPFVIVGGTPTARGWFLDQLTRIGGPDKIYHGCTAVEAELIKYMENSFLATKVTFVNEFYEICQVFGADWNAVREGWLLDPRIGRSHSAVFVDDRGFAGKCLPKDVNAIVKAASVAGYLPELLRAVLSANEGFRKAGTPDALRPPR